ncbi:hypothetical protein FACS1894200_13620 [Spirochaetia bacterium]|nr:hypothetical protein FACS1894200_13620 [Spirochaetia bacterium]
MPLELKYVAMKYGPVPIEIYDNRETTGYFSLVVFEPLPTVRGSTTFLIKPIGKFNADFFAETELNEMKDLIDIFAQRWVTAKVMSDSSHSDIRAWSKTYQESPNAIIDPIREFKRDISHLSEEELAPEEERYLFQKSIRDFCKC